jgi:hypothetical protein
MLLDRDSLVASSANKVISENPPDHNLREGRVGGHFRRD